MKFTINNLTFVIVTFKSNDVIRDCLNSIPKEFSKIIIENSSDGTLKKELEQNYDNLEVVLSNNIGMGSGNNIGILRSKTEYVYVLNPDARLEKNTINQINDTIENLEDFSIMSPLSNAIEYPNFKKKIDDDLLNKDLVSVNEVDGFSMILNKKKFNNHFFDENIFMYLENSDLCLRMIKQNQKVYIISKAKIFHLGGKAVDEKFSKEVELSRNWHWMWSKYYFNKKHFGSIKALSLIFINLFSSSFKWFLFFIILKKDEKIKYKMRTCGLVSSILGKSSYYRPKVN